MGISGVDQASSLDMLVLQHEIISYVESVLREIDFSDEAIGLGEIKEVGPGGTFIDREHTARRFRKEIWFPKLLDRSFYQAWLDGGAADTEERCRRRKEEILRTHSSDPISGDLARALDEVVEAARSNLRRG